MFAQQAASIKIVNDFVDKKYLSELKTDASDWSYGIYPGLQGLAYPSWHIHLCGGKNIQERAIHDDVLNATPGLESVNGLWKLIKEDLASDYGLVRVCASGHPYGLEGTTHRYSKPSDQELVALLYINSEWEDAWAGETVFYDPARECISIRPRPGRLLLFDGSLPRVSRAPSRDCPTLCATLCFYMRRTHR